MENRCDSKRVDLIVFAGQSNMSGRGEAGAAVQCADGAGYEYKAVSHPEGLLPIREPFGLNEDKEGAISDRTEDGGTKRRGSMVSAVADTYHARTGRTIVGVSASIGGSNTEQWKQVYLADAVERLDQAKAFLSEHQFLVERLFVVWCQGESDGDAKRSAADYTANTREIFRAFQAHGAEKCFLVQIGHYNYVDYPEGQDGLTGQEWDCYYEVVRNAQAALCETDEDFIFAGSFEDCLHDMKDDYHYHQNAYNKVGNQVGGALADYVLAHH